VTMVGLKGRGGGSLESDDLDRLHLRAWCPSRRQRRQQAGKVQAVETWSGCKHLNHLPTKSTGIGQRGGVEEVADASVTTSCGVG
jgi:hypothetical protein